MSVILTENIESPILCEKEILRYAGCKQPDDAVSELLKRCIEIAAGSFSYKVCYGIFDLCIKDDSCDFGVFKAESKALAKNLQGCDRAVIFGATVGVGIDRLIMKYSRISPAMAVMLQALGAERIEALCDSFCRKIEIDLKCDLKPRFSPGYGDLPLTVQKDILSVLDCNKKIGLSLNESLLMSPTKSVTAFVGIVN